MLPPLWRMTCSGAWWWCRAEFFSCTQFIVVTETVAPKLQLLSIYNLNISLWMNPLEIGWGFVASAQLLSDKLQPNICLSMMTERLKSVNCERPKNHWKCMVQLYDPFWLICYFEVTCEKVLRICIRAKQIFELQTVTGLLHWNIKTRDRRLQTILIFYK